MDIKALKKFIAMNNIPKFMIFDAMNSLLCKQYLTSISDTLGKHYKYYDTADEVLYETTTNLREDYLYIVLNDDKVLKNPNYVTELLKTGRNIILYFTNLDNQSAFYKSNKEHIVEFKQLDKYTIVAYLMKQLEKNKIEVEQSKIETLVDYCNCDLGCCMNELDKIIVLGQTNSNALFNYMMEKGFSDYRQTEIFNFIYKILNKDSSVYDDATRLDENFIGLLTLLYKNARTKLISSDKPRYAEIMKLCYRLDSCIKDGRLKDTYLLDYLLLKTC